MQTIYLKKFGKVLISRPAGLEAFKGIRPTLDKRESMQIDFGDVLAVTPSWFDEFLTNLAEYAEEDVVLLPTYNASVLAALPVLITGRQDKAAKIIQRFLDENKK
ncbi:hypothetical protein HY504_03700 [Candidatus Wolfebacteria bacterium]|nr:hypothetical protein [Candidatus Wolfebacteria bacterium]